jgi:hypothetical protein
MKARKAMNVTGSLAAVESHQRRSPMRAGKFLAMFAIAALVIGALGAAALAAKKKKKKTEVIFFNGSPFFKGVAENNVKVSANGSLNTVSACEPNRSMRLQVLDADGVVLTTLDGSTSDSSGNWKLAGHSSLRTLPTANSVRVKAKKRTVGKFVCQAGVTPNVAIPGA